LGHMENSSLSPKRHTIDEWIYQTAIDVMIRYDLLQFLHNSVCSYDDNKIFNHDPTVVFFQ